VILRKSRDCSAISTVRARVRLVSSIVRRDSYRLVSALAGPNPIEAYYLRLMDKPILAIAITNPAFIEGRGFVAHTVMVMRSLFHVFPRICLPASTSSGR
jgi:hypothetical protein